MKEVVIVFGGESVESEISKKTALSIYKNIDREKFQASLVDYLNFNVQDLNENTVVFIAIHGKGGEDGEIQKILEQQNIPFTGSGYLSSTYCWDKEMSKKILIENSINTPEFLHVDNLDIDLKKDFFQNLNQSYFVKPTASGSSFGIKKINKLSDIREAVEEALKYSKSAIIERAFNYSEYTVSILKGVAFQPLEIVTNGNSVFYDYEAKYLSTLTRKELVTNEILSQELKDLALRAFDAHFCKTWGRGDIVSDGDKLAVIDLNTVPGFTELSLFPISAKAEGISFKQLITEIIADATN